VADERELSAAAPKLGSGALQLRRSRAQVELDIRDRRQAIALYEAKARNALEQGREDIAREALRWKVFSQKKLSQLDAELRELAQDEPLPKRPDAPARTDRPPNTALSPGPSPSALIAIAQQEIRWDQGPGGAAMRAMTKDNRDLDQALRDLTTARRATDRQAISSATRRLQSAAISLESHVTAAMAAPPRPDAESQRLWARTLVNTHTAAVNARAYAQNPDQARLTQIGEAARASQADMKQIAAHSRAIAAALKQHSAHRGTDEEHNRPKAKPGASGISVKDQALQPTAATPAPKNNLPSLESLLVQLDSLTGLAPVKADVRQIIDMARVSQMRQAAGLPVAQVSRHLVFTGNPGTGKTTVGRLLAQLYSAIGILRTGQLVEVTRSDLVAGYVGQTAIKTTAAVTRALGGVLFIDEAYSLARASGSGQDFGLEAIDTIVKMMEDNRDQLIVIAAGYSHEMTNFINANPGLPSRFPHIIHFPDYTNNELIAIFAEMCRQNKYDASGETFSSLRQYIANLPREQGFGNGRLIRNIFEAALTRQASRIIATGESNLTHLALSDLGLPPTDPHDGNTSSAPPGPYI
jgi:Holliday junction resolvasome RuvABC ATP-dependent DNA helicase subunit